jgi:two-component system, chemotaxis family, protein-glutamate methylesterase/glutaminase
MLNGRKTRVLIVDDSAIVRKILSDSLAGEPDLEVVGTAPDPYIARDKILALAPDVLTLDIEMPRMDGLTFLKKLMHFHPMPVVVISSLAQPSCRIAVQALENGAVEVMAKPGGPYSVGELRKSLAAKIRAAGYSRVKPPPAVPVAGPLSLPPSAQASPPTGAILAIGASTGGTEAIVTVLRELPANSPPIVIAQHIPPEFSKAFAGRMNDLCAMEVREAADGDALRPGLALVAPGDLHMLVKKSGGRYSVAVKTGPRVCYQRPSVDVLFSSVAESAGAAATGVILTGMGSDGAQGMLKMRDAGAYTIAQDEATCVVFGMPREAIGLDAVDQILPLHAIAVALLNPKPARKTAAAS